VCLGSWVFGGDCWGEVDDAQSERVVREAVEKGINFIDTAPVYGAGRAESVIGRALQGVSDKVIIATKCGLEQKGSSIKPNLSAAFIKEEVENSLRRLGVDVIDLYQCHWPDPNTPLEETFSTLKGLIEEGKIRHIGVSNFDRSLMKRASSLAPIISNQMQYSLLDRTIEKDLIPFCGEHGISVLAYGPLAGGILTGKYKTPPNFSKGNVKSFFYKYYREPAWTKAMALVALLREIAEKRHVPTADIAISWVLSCPEVASCIVGCRTPQQLDENIRAAGIRLKEEELAKIRG